MKYNFTDDVREILARARQIAIDVDQDILDSDQVLTALLEFQRGELRKLLESLDFDPTRVGVAMRRGLQRGRGAGAIILGEMPYSDSAKTLLERAIVISQERKHVRIGADHMFAAAADTNELLAAALTTAGIRRDDVLQQLDANQRP